MVQQFLFGYHLSNRKWSKAGHYSDPTELLCPDPWQESIGSNPVATRWRWNKWSGGTAPRPEARQRPYSSLLQVISYSGRGGHLSEMQRKTPVEAQGFRRQLRRGARWRRWPGGRSTSVTCRGRGRWKLKVSGGRSSAVEGDGGDREAGAPQWPAEEEAGGAKRGDCDREAESGTGATWGWRGEVGSVGCDRGMAQWWQWCPKRKL
jgi:hypothetical protein